MIQLQDIKLYLVNPYDLKIKLNHKPLQGSYDKTAYWFDFAHQCETVYYLKYDYLFF